MVMLKYWFRPISVPSSHLVSHCYKTLLEQTRFNDEWIQRMLLKIFDSLIVGRRLIYGRFGGWGGGNLMFVFPEWL